MKAKRNEILTIVLFCGFLVTMMFCYLVLPKDEFSEREKRYLQNYPEINTKDLLSGEYGNDIETFMADHIPARDFWVGMNSYYDMLSGRQRLSDVRVLEGQRLVEAPVKWDRAAAERNMAAINAFSQALGQKVDIMLVPSAGWAADIPEVRTADLFGKDIYNDADIITSIYAMAGENLNSVDILDIMSGREDYYFRTDHHWNSEGVFSVYSAYMEMKFREHSTKQDYTIERIDGFYGSNHSRSALWAIPGEAIELWHSDTNLSVSNGETEDIHEGVFYRERLNEADKYTVYLDGNHSIVRIDNPEMEGRGKILVIRDSYCNIMGGFLAESYESVVMVDLRYYKKPVSELCSLESFDDILVCYSIGNFIGDENIIWLK